MENLLVMSLLQRAIPSQLLDAFRAAVTAANNLMAALEARLLHEASQSDALSALKTNTSLYPLAPVMAKRLIKLGIDTNLTADQLTDAQKTSLMRLDVTKATANCI
jgi:hypothetical protein